KNKSQKGIDRLLYYIYYFTNTSYDVIKLNGGDYMKPNHISQINQVKEAVEEVNVQNIYFVACGGSLASLSTGDYFIDRELSIPSKAMTSNEFIHTNPKGLGENSVVILRSH